MQNKWYALKMEGEAAIVDLEGEVGYEISAAQFKADLLALGDYKSVVLNINSPGGSVIEGFALVDILNAVKVPKTAIISGWAASMASIIACACDQVKMSKASWMVIHNPWSCLQGDSKELRKMADVLDKMKQSALDVYQTHTEKTRDEISQLLDAETWIRGEDAVGEGWNFHTIENIENQENNMQLNLKSLKGFRNLPAALMNLVSAPASAPETVAPPVAVVEAPAPISAPENATIVVPVDVAQIEAKHVAEITAMKAQIEAETAAKSAALNELDGVKAELLQARATVAKLSPGLMAPEAEVSDFSDALRRCDGDYVKARKQYPDAYNKAVLQNSKR